MADSSKGQTRSCNPSDSFGKSKMRTASSVKFVFVFLWTAEKQQLCLTETEKTGEVGRSAEVKKVTKGPVGGLKANTAAHAPVLDHQHLVI